ncbi:flagellar motor switch protein FliM [Candidatus Nitrotoga sp. M5]|uniref:flagellar motor switch protein FliM n=1 Tax=Candidatus Nitrotoga sp. M5 TaxID=2890409 RepID=UPI001EF4E720|nr:flagellar motor switch protein FliM [Candidatus Nitrotoga sp. M5]CAH1387759.1 flagellar motor switch protein FliM [Candidatus Nitrotoga sp. M5]
MSDFLSQEEVDSLLKGVNFEPDEVAAVPDPAGTVRPYNMGSQERIVRGRMPALEILNERFARSFRITLFNLIRRTAEISVGPIRVQKFSEFLRNLPVPANINIVQANPLRGNGLFIFDPNLIFLVVDNMFGGDGRFHSRVEGREFTQTEQRIIQRLLAAVFESYNKAWQAIYALQFEFVRSEMNPQFATIATPNEIVVSTTFDIEFGGVGGAFHVLLPYSMIEPIRELLCSSMQGDHTVVDKRWLRTLSKQVQSAEIELTVVLGHAQIKFEQVLGMRNGDFIPLEIADSITALVDEVPVIQCKYGIFNNQYALKVEKILSGTSGDLANGDNDD